MTKKAILLIAVGSLLIAAAALYWLSTPQPKVLTAKEQADRKAIESLKETQDEVNKLKAHGVN